MAEALLALWKGSREQSMSFMGRPAEEPTVEDARSQLERSSYVDYWNGRVIKVDFSREPLDLYLYNRDNGTGAGEQVLTETVGSEQ